MTIKLKYKYILKDDLKLLSLIVLNFQKKVEQLLSTLKLSVHVKHETIEENSGM
jgi:hypothetical protein